MAVGLISIVDDGVAVANDIGGCASMVCVWATEAVCTIKVDMLDGENNDIGVGVDRISPLEKFMAIALTKQIQHKLTMNATE